MTLNKSLFSSASEEWTTPQSLFDALNEEFRFTLDAAATAANAKCFHFFDKGDNGLKQDWFHTCLEYKVKPVVFVNPPYGKTIYQWVKKGFESTQTSPHMVTVMLLPARTDTRWWHEFVMQAHEIRFIRGRVKFGHGKESAPFPSCIVVFKDIFAEGNQLKVLSVKL